jgi:hypothetical protein
VASNIKAAAQAPTDTRNAEKASRGEIMRRVFTEGRSSTWAAIGHSFKQKYPANNGWRAFWANPRKNTGASGTMMSLANTPII